MELEELQLFGNELSGAIPSSISNLVNLRLLSLGEYTGGNNFTPAPLPPAFASLCKLEALFMAHCQVTGSLPPWIGCLGELRQLDLQRNSMTGTIPSQISHLTELLYLNLKDNEGMNGVLPISALVQLTKLNRLSLVHCNFSNSTQENTNLMQIHLPRCKIWL